MTGAKSAASITEYTCRGHHSGWHIQCQWTCNCLLWRMRLSNHVCEKSCIFNHRRKYWWLENCAFAIKRTIYRYESYYTTEGQFRNTLLGQGFVILLLKAKGSLLKLTVSCVYFIFVFDLHFTCNNWIHRREHLHCFYLWNLGSTVFANRNCVLIIMCVN